MKIYSGFFPLAFGAIACLLSLALFISPRSPSTQPAGFSLALDLDDADGDQSVSSLDLIPDQPFFIQIFASDIQNANRHIHALWVRYKATDLRGIRSRRGPAERPRHRTAGFHVAPYRRFVVKRIGNGERRVGRHGSFSRHGHVFGYGGVAVGRGTYPGWRVRDDIACPRRGAAGGRVPVPPTSTTTDLSGFSDFVVFAGVYRFRARR